MGCEPDVTRLLVAWNAGDDTALEKLAPLIASELHRLASRFMAGERPGHVLQSTALVNEAYVRLVGWNPQIQWQNRAQFFGVAAQMMRRILVDLARGRKRAKRGGAMVQVSLSRAADVAALGGPDLVALDDALQTLAKLDPRQSRVVELRFFGGLTHEETAEVLHVSVATVRRDWSLARAWLYREVNRRGAR
jgi:RNA polymerase sigma factor (TIGR02999 family)